MCVLAVVLAGLRVSLLADQADVVGKGILGGDLQVDVDGQPHVAAGNRFLDDRLGDQVAVLVLDDGARAVRAVQHILICRLRARDADVCVAAVAFFNVVVQFFGRDLADRAEQVRGVAVVDIGARRFLGDEHLQNRALLDVGQQLGVHVARQRVRLDAAELSVLHVKADAHEGLQRLRVVKVGVGPGLLRVGGQPVPRAQEGEELLRRCVFVQLETVEQRGKFGLVRRRLEEFFVLFVVREAAREREGHLDRGVDAAAFFDGGKHVEDDRVEGVRLLRHCAVFQADVVDLCIDDQCLAVCIVDLAALCGDLDIARGGFFLDDVIVVLSRDLHVDEDDEIDRADEDKQRAERADPDGGMQFAHA